MAWLIWSDIYCFYWNWCTASLQSDGKRVFEGLNSEMKSTEKLFMNIYERTNFVVICEAFAFAPQDAISISCIKIKFGWMQWMANEFSIAANAHSSLSQMQFPRALRKKLIQFSPAGDVSTRDESLMAIELVGLRLSGSVSRWESRNK